jgi:hypothetical protein
LGGEWSGKLAGERRSSVAASLRLSAATLSGCWPRILDVRNYSVCAEQGVHMHRTTYTAWAEQHIAPLQNVIIAHEEHGFAHAQTGYTECFLIQSQNSLLCLEFN